MEDTKSEKKKSDFLADLKKMPDEVYKNFKKYSLIKKGILIWCTYFVIENLTKSLSMNKEDIFSNVIDIPKKVWNNFWTAPTGKKFILCLAAWYVVKNLFNDKEKESEIENK